MIYNETLRKEKETIITKDGSITLYSKEFNESYHSPKDGALHESLQKHVLPAFDFHQDTVATQLTILDICYGLGKKKKREENKKKKRKKKEKERKKEKREQKKRE